MLRAQASCLRRADPRSWSKPPSPSDLYFSGGGAEPVVGLHRTHSTCYAKKSNGPIGKALGVIA